MSKIIYRIKMVVYHFQSLFAVYILRKLPVYWFNGRVNFGDLINIYLVEKISNKKVHWVHPKYWPLKNYLVIGSVLENANSCSIVWGSGSISENSKFSLPNKAFAVRGPKTRSRLLNAGMKEFPEVYGDPALLLPSFYTPKKLECKYKLGVIPHYVDKSLPVIEEMKIRNDNKVIDIEQSNPFSFIDEICSCDFIISSSLHGVIVAAAYNIPVVWVRFSNNVVGGSFKFLDFLRSVGINHIDKPVVIHHLKDLDCLPSSVIISGIDIDLEKLLECCPFKNV